MATMTIRTTVSFDPATTARLERLAKRWGVSKSETLRRALEKAEMVVSESPAPTDKPTLEDIATMSPSDALAWLQTHTLVSPEEGDRWRAELRENREDFATRS